MIQCFNICIVGYFVGVVVVMGVLFWVVVLFYNWFCKVIGYGGMMNVVMQVFDYVLEEKVCICFDVNVDFDMGWIFCLMQCEMELCIGENVLVFYEVINISDEFIIGMVSYNVVLDLVGYYFSKMQCFCFIEQML